MAGMHSGQSPLPPRQAAMEDQGPQLNVSGFFKLEKVKMFHSKLKGVINQCCPPEDPGLSGTKIHIHHSRGERREGLA